MHKCFIDSLESWILTKNKGIGDANLLCHQRSQKTT
jgi:hypothetical protein